MKVKRFLFLNDRLPLLTIDLNGKIVAAADSTKKRTRDDEPPVLYVTPPTASQEEKEEAIRKYHERYPARGQE